MAKLREKNCKQCEEKFKDNSKTNRVLYCSTFCRNRYFRLKNKDYQKNYMSSYNKNYFEKNKKSLLEYSKKRWKKIKNTPECKEYHNNYKKHNMLNNSEYRKKKLIRDMVYRDKLKNPHLYLKECCICGVNENIEFHHPNYDFPYLVYPLCRAHHIQIHKNEVIM